jgi:hypothetical protein
MMQFKSQLYHKSKINIVMADIETTMVVTLAVIEKWAPCIVKTLTTVVSKPTRACEKAGLSIH